VRYVWLSVAAATGTIGVSAAALLIRRVVRAEREALTVPVNQHLPHGGETALILGARTYAGGPSPELQARLQHALAIMESRGISTVIVSGGIDHDLDEVDSMRSWLEAHGIEPSSIIEARPGGTTRETMRAVAAVASTRELGRIIAVSTRYHARRIRDEARRHGLDVVSTGPAESPETSHAAIRRARILTEAAATAFYALPASLTGHIATPPGSWRHTMPMVLAGRLRAE
jgi:vancomycin permeability regulator SanA